MKSTPTTRRIPRANRPALCLAFLLFLGLWSAGAVAYDNIDCDCDPSISSETDSDGQYCRCEKDFTIGPAATHEFHFRCLDEHVDNDAYYSQIGDLSSSTTCTIGIYVPFYQSRSCTNWSPFKKDTLHLWTQCYLDTGPPNQ